MQQQNTWPACKLGRTHTALPQAKEMKTQMTSCRIGHIIQPPLACRLIQGPVPLPGPGTCSRGSNKEGFVMCTQAALTEPRCRKGSAPHPASLGPES